jgi:hypothetical protein
MMTTHDEEYVGQERAAMVAWRFAQGAQLTTQQVADLCGLSYSGAWYLLQRISRVLPIVKDNRGDYWYNMDWYKRMAQRRE